MCNACQQPAWQPWLQQQQTLLFLSPSFVEVFAVLLPWTSVYGTLKHNCVSVFCIKKFIQHNLLFDPQINHSITLDYISAVICSFESSVFCFKYRIYYFRLFAELQKPSQNIQMSISAHIAMILMILDARLRLMRFRADECLIAIPAHTLLLWLFTQCLTISFFCFNLFQAFSSIVTCISLVSETVICLLLLLSTFSCLKAF